MALTSSQTNLFGSQHNSAQETLIAEIKLDVKEPWISLSSPLITLSVRFTQKKYCVVGTRGVMVVFRNDAQTLMHRHPASYLAFSLTKVCFWTVYRSRPSTLRLWITKSKAIKGNGWTGWLARVWRRRPFISNCSDVSFWSDCLYHYRSGLCSACMTRLAEKKRGERANIKKERGKIWAVEALRTSHSDFYTYSTSNIPFHQTNEGLNLSAQSANLAFSWLMIRIRVNDYWK